MDARLRRCFLHHMKNNQKVFEKHIGEALVVSHKLMLCPETDIYITIEFVSFLLTFQLVKEEDVTDIESCFPSVGNNTVSRQFVTRINSDVLKGVVNNLIRLWEKFLSGNPVFSPDELGIEVSEFQQLDQVQIWTF